MSLSGRNVFFKELWTNFEQMLVIGITLPILMVVLLGPFLSPSQAAAIAMALVGVWFSTVATLYLVRGRRAAREWQPRPLKWVEARVGTEDVMLDSGFGERYFPAVNYQYSVDGTSCTGTCYHLDAVTDKSFSLEEVQGLVKRASEATEVFVNPNSPSESCLFAEQGIACACRYVVVLGIGILLLALGISALVHA